MKKLTWKHWNGTMGNGFGSSGISSETADKLEENMAWWLDFRCCGFDTRLELEALARSRRNMALLFMMMWLLRDEPDAPTEAEVGDVAVISFGGGKT
jgi:hypothetical protein